MDDRLVHDDPVPVTCVDEEIVGVWEAPTEIVEVTDGVADRVPGKLTVSVDRAEREKLDTEDDALGERVVVVLNNGEYEVFVLRVGVNVTLSEGVCRTEADGEKVSFTDGVVLSVRASEVDTLEEADVVGDE